METQTTLFEISKMERFNIFHRKNPEVYKYFVTFALTLINRGYSRISGRLIIERVRYETMIKTDADDGFKINNDHISHYSRLFVREYPEHFDKFEFRKLRNA